MFKPRAGVGMISALSFIWDALHNIKEAWLLHRDDCILSHSHLQRQLASSVIKFYDPAL